MTPTIAGFARREHDLALALVAFTDPRTPARIAALLRAEGRAGLESRLAAMPAADSADVVARAATLAERGVGAVLLGDADYPRRLLTLPAPPPVLFYMGALALANDRAIGMCGSRKASDIGLRAARACGEEVASHGMTIVSGYAKGVDTETHLAALTTGGRTVIVLAEGIEHFRTKRVFHGHLDLDRVLILSQFPPSQPWSAAGAMTRNAIIVALGQALVVVEAGDRGGTLAAGEFALRLGRPLFVLHFGDETPAGNVDLARRGGVVIDRRDALGAAVAQLADVTQAAEQLAL